MSNLFSEGIDFLKSLVFGRDDDGEQPIKSQTAKSTPAVVLPKVNIAQPKQEQLYSKTPSKVAEVETGQGPTRTAAAAMKVAQSQGDTVKQVAKATKPQVSPATKQKLETGGLSMPKPTPAVNKTDLAKSVTTQTKSSTPSMTSEGNLQGAKMGIEAVGGALGFGGDVAKAVLRAPQRAIASVGIQPAADLMDVPAVYAPQSKLEKFVFGSEPIKGVGLELAEAQKKTDEYLKSKGFDTDISKGMSLAIAPLFVGGMKSLDLTPVGGAENAEKQALKNIAKSADEAAILRNLKKVVSGSDETLGALSKALVHVDDAAKVKSIVDDFKIEKTAAKAAPIMPETVAQYPGGTTIDKSILNKEQQKALSKIEEIKGAPLTHAEVNQAAQEAELLQRTIPREATKEFDAQVVATRNANAALDEQIAKTTDPKLKELLINRKIQIMQDLHSFATDWGRTGQAFQIGNDRSIMDQVLARINKERGAVDGLAERAAKVDWTSPEEVTNFLNKEVKPTWGDMLKEYRYNNALANPRTFERNLFSNLVQTFVTRPLTKTVETGIDSIHSMLTGEPRQNFFAELPAYYKGIFSNFNKGMQDFADSFTGKAFVGQQDLKDIPQHALPQWFNLPTRVMEATDQLLQRLIMSGEEAANAVKGSHGATPSQAPKDIAMYSLFRNGLDETNKSGQGWLLSKIDKATAGIDSMRKKASGVDWFVMFLRTPMNFAKQWLEYAPGVHTPLMFIGAKNKSEVLAKQLIGASVMAYGAQKAMAGETTWGVPVDEEAKNLFFASGKKPYSVKINDQWVPMIYLGPAALALGLPAAMKYYYEDDPHALTDPAYYKTLKGIGGAAELLSQQTFLQSLGNMVDLLRGEQTLPQLEKTAAFTAAQLLPWNGLLRYMSTIIDPVYRKSDGLLEAFGRDLPFLSKNLEAYKDPLGNESKRNATNYTLPFDISQEKPEYDRMLQQREEILRFNAKFNAIDTENKKEATKMLEEFYTNKDIDLQKFGDKLSNNDALKQAFMAVAEKYANYTAATIEPLKMLTPKERAEIIYGRFILSKNQEDINKNVGEFVKQLQDNGLFDQSVADALANLVSKDSQLQQQKAVESETEQQFE